MLKGHALGDALRRAMQAKKVVQRQVAAEFGITQPSVSEWLKHGRIDKAHINHLVAYFSDVVRPSHWGLPDTWGAMPSAPAPAAFSDRALRVAAIYDQVSASDRRHIDAIADAATSVTPTQTSEVMPADERRPGVPTKQHAPGR